MPIPRSRGSIPRSGDVSPPLPRLDPPLPRLDPRSGDVSPPLRRLDPLLRRFSPPLRRCQSPAPATQSPASAMSVPWLRTEFPRGLAFATRGAGVFCRGQGFQNKGARSLEPRRASRWRGTGLREPGHTARAGDVAAPARVHGSGLPELGSLRASAIASSGGPTARRQEKRSGRQHRALPEPWPGCARLRRRARAVSAAACLPRSCSAAASRADRRGWTRLLRRRDRRHGA
jgi:hypothetical protein